MKANGTAIKVIRQRTGLSLSDMKAATGLNRGYLSELERGLKGARRETLEKFAGALSTTLDAIVRDAQ
jgi:transcriptional regulator with XRE-family HTH domain